jgi:hypothetical protein
MCERIYNTLFSWYNTLFSWHNFFKSCYSFGVYLTIIFGISCFLTTTSTLIQYKSVAKDVKECYFWDPTQHVRNRTFSEDHSDWWAYGDPVSNREFISVPMSEVSYFVFFLTFQMIMTGVIIQRNTASQAGMTREAFSQWFDRATSDWRRIGCLITLGATIFTVPFGFAVYDAVKLTITIANTTIPKFLIFGPVATLIQFYMSCVFFLFWLLIGLIALVRYYLKPSQSLTLLDEPSVLEINNI